VMNGLKLTPTPPDKLGVSVRATLQSTMPLPVSIGAANCLVTIDTLKGKAGFTDIGLTTDVQLSVDGATDLTNIHLMNTAVQNLDASMLDIQPAGMGLVDLLCLGADLPGIQQALVGVLQSTLTKQIDSRASDGFCAACMTQMDCDSFADACKSGKC